MKKFFKKLYRPHSLIVTILIFLFIWTLDLIRLNLHFLDPFNYALKNYEVYDIVYSRMGTRPEDIHDEIVFVDIGQPEREELAWLIERISAAAPRVIGVDILLRERKDPATDSLLQEVIREAGNVVLATELPEYNDSLQLFAGEIGCDTFFSNYAATGFVDFIAADRNQTIRLFTPREPTPDGYVSSFAFSVVEQYDPRAAQRLLKRDKKVERIHYSGDVNSFGGLFTKDDIFFRFEDLGLQEAMRDKIVLIGYLGGDSFGESITDRYYTPLNKQYAGHSPPDMFGVVIHANIISMIIEGKYIYQVPKWLRRVLAFVFCYANVILIYWIYRRFNEAFHGITRVVQVVECLLLFLLLSALFFQFRLKLDFETGILALVLAYDFVMIYESLILRKFPALKKIPHRYFTKKLRPPIRVSDQIES